MRTIYSRAQAWDRQQYDKMRKQAREREAAANAAAAAAVEEAAAGLEQPGGSQSQDGSGGQEGGAGAAGGADAAAAGPSSGRALVPAGAAAGAAAAGGAGVGGAVMAPQVRIGEDGQLVVDVSSLTVQAQQQEVSTFRRVDEQVRFCVVRWALWCRCAVWLLSCVRGVVFGSKHFESGCQLHVCCLKRTRKHRTLLYSNCG